MTRVAQSSIDPIVFRQTENLESLLRKQPEWFRELLEVIEYKDGFANPFEIMEEHDSTDGLFVVADGSVKLHYMSFGWVIANMKGEILVQGAGPSAGKGSSLRAEGSGMLCATVFLSLVCVFTNRFDITAHCWSDNAELIRRLKKHKKYEHPFPNETTSAEYDLTEQIYQTAKAYNMKTSYN